jgi:hypothetical protein
MTDKTQKPSNPKQYYSDTISIHDFFKCLSKKITILLECWEEEYLTSPNQQIVKVKF